MNAGAIKSKLHWPLGVIAGLLAALLVMPFFGDQGQAREESTVGPVLSDCDGAMNELVIQYTTGSSSIVSDTYREFLTQLPPEVTVHVVCRDQGAFDDLTSRVGSTECKLNPVFVDHELTSWSRDRWISLAPAGSASSFTLLSPWGEMGADAWPARKGDERIGEDLAAALSNTEAVRSELFFDGGDFVCDNETAFVTPNVRLRNLQNTVKDEEELLHRLRELLGRKVVLLKDAPDHHAGMYMMTAGNHTVVVGDPSAAKALLNEEEIATLPLPEGADFSDETQRKFDSVASQCESAGYRVVRIPVAPGKDGRVFLTYLNSILDERDDKRSIYMPTFSGAERLNEAGAKVWKDLGFEVKTVDCSNCYRYFGSLRCLVNILSRS
ncbi:MAG: agmatine deiminase family protein [Planctomycetes bacterium]|nr:agmatine deiminase family protein [Planctomycetota bacterium]